MTHYPTKPYNIAIKYQETHADKNLRDYQEIAASRSYMPPTPSLESMKELYEKNKIYKSKVTLSILLP